MSADPKKTDETVEEIARFCSRLLGTDPKAPLAGVQSAPLAGVVLETWFKLRGSDEKPAAKRDAPQDFEDAVFSQPWTVYSIRCSANGRVYVGRASKGFTDRYPGGRWWDRTHSAMLKSDLEQYGRSSFRVAIHACADEDDMIRVEAELQRSNRLFTYNIKREPDAK